MSLRHEEPPVPDTLQPYISRCLHTYSDEETGFFMVLPPTGVMYLTLVYGDEMTLQYGDAAATPSPRLFVGGQVRRVLPVSRISGRVGLMGVEFTPTGFYRLFQQDCSAFADRATPLSDLVSALTADIESHLVSETDSALRMDWLQGLLLERATSAAEAPLVEKAVQRIEEDYGCVSMDAVARHCGIGTRQLRRLFLEVIGVGPKHFAKTVQIKRTLLAIEQANAGELAVLAQSAGYFDQAHFIHDFQRLIGTNPIAFLRSGHPFFKTYINRAR